MFYQSVPKLQQWDGAKVAHGQAPVEVGASASGWQLAGHQALTLKPSRAGRMRVVRGRLWVTLNGPHGHHPDDSGDMVLVKGQSLEVPPHQRLVIEPWQVCANEPAYFRWEPLPVTDQ